MLPAPVLVFSWLYNHQYNSKHVTIEAELFGARTRILSMLTGNCMF
jgi:hypothetical protein